MIARLNGLAMWNGTAGVNDLFVRLTASWRMALGEGGDVCPRCGGQTLRRSHIRWYEVWRQFVPYRPYRCRACYHRMWRRPTPDIAQTPAQTAVAAVDSRPSDIDLSDLDAPLDPAKRRRATIAPKRRRAAPGSRAPK